MDAEKGCKSSRRTLALTLLVLVLLTGCATGAPMSGQVGATVSGHRAPARYAQSADSATNGCLRNPACYTQTGDEAVIPWVSHAVEATRTVVTVMQLLETAELARVEQILVDCAKDANFKVNEDEFGEGNRPTPEQCNEVVRKENGKDVTRAMDLGRMKHAVALECVQRELGKRFPGNFTVQPHYKYDPQTGRWLMLDPKLVAKWLEDKLFELLLGTLVPDVVIHASGNPNKVQRVYDYKFPCLPSRRDQPVWRRYPEGHPYYPRNQGQMYKDALLNGEGEPSFVTPQLGVTQ